MNSAVATALVVGIPSVVIAVFTYWLSVRARRETATSARLQIDAEAYSRARELYESAITSLREQVTDLRGELARQRVELEELRAWQRAHL